MKDRRAHKRVKVDLRAAYKDDGFVLRTGRVLNLGKGGMYLETGRGVALGGFVDASIDDREFGKVISVRGRVAHKTPDGVGVTFVRVDRLGLMNILTYHGAPF
ncbi:MAG TPA: PilZ domain-containing protein [Deltaproteobacteria bacterium]|nr:PilZ domain-containing protein [Deltaproteobacteria bacterium]HOM30306.1 PilZ domain-containing protein [Deltaproteobacteria bacterium]HPP79369.1 PilZ domain-containing protein [Deltaproteobacteria bacterium]